MYAVSVAAVVFIGVLIAAGLLMWSLSVGREIRRQQLTERLGPATVIPHLMRERELDPIGRLLGPLGQRLHDLRVRAGQRGNVGEVVLICSVIGVAAPLVAGALIQGPLVPLSTLLAALPILALMAQAAARSRKISVQLPDALDLMARALRAGHAFPDALRMTAAEMPAPIGEELVHTAEEHQLGLELRECLGGLVERVPESFELRLFVGGVLLNRDTGGNLIEILEHLADTIRERMVFEGKVRALTAEVRTSATILATLPFLAAGLLSTVEPGYLLPLLEPGLGRTLLVGGVLSMTMGIILMRRLSHVEM